VPKLSRRSGLRSLAAPAVATLALLSAAPALAASGNTVVDGISAGSVTTSPLGSRGQNTPPLPTDITAKTWLVLDIDTGAVLGGRGLHTTLPPASTEKLLTALTALRMLTPDQKVTPTVHALSVAGTKAGLVPGHAYTVQDLLKTMLMTSANDAAETFADAAGGDTRFVGLMNDSARRLGATDGHAMDPSGLDAPDQALSVMDLALIARAVLHDPVLAPIVASATSSMTGSQGQTIPLTNHNRLLTKYPGAIGAKTGYTSQAGATYVGAAAKNGHTIVIAFLSAAENLWPEAISMLDWGFQAAATPQEQPIAQLAVAKTGSLPKEPLTPPVVAPHPAGESAQTTASSSSSDSGSGITALQVAVVITLLACIGTAVRERRRRVLARSKTAPETAANSDEVPYPEEEPSSAQDTDVPVAAAAVAVAVAVADDLTAISPAEESALAAAAARAEESPATDSSADDSGVEVAPEPAVDAPVAEVTEVTEVTVADSSAEESAVDVAAQPAAGDHTEDLALIHAAAVETLARRKRGRRAKPAPAQAEEPALDYEQPELLVIPSDSTGEQATAVIELDSPRPESPTEQTMVIPAIRETANF
jgi:D-alanyl-D-alanine carboxypeptidase (penicillin-binding protein 5/6)